jgi:membrane associated rhomboid family serine protease
MARSPSHPLETILRECERAGGQPWYPSAYSREIGIPREHIDPYLDQLRMAGLIQLTDWVQGNGQGYVLTPAGRFVLQSPPSLAAIREGSVPDVAQRGQQAPTPVQPAFRGMQRAQVVQAAFQTPRPPVVTFALILLNVGWFLTGLAIAYQHGGFPDDIWFSSPPLVLKATGALSPRWYYVDHEWWRLLTCCFVHIGLVHLGVNMYSLYAVGPLLEQLWGSWRFLVLYLIAGFAGSCAMIIEAVIGGRPDTIGAGASGALWGILASMATWLFFNRSVLPQRVVSVWQHQLLTVFVLNAMLTFGVTGISKGAHFGGGAAGLLVAIPMDYLRFGTGPQRIVAVLGLVAIPVVCLLALGRYRDEFDARRRQRFGAVHNMSVIIRSSAPSLPFSGAPANAQGGAGPSHLLAHPSGSPRMT